MCDHQVHPDDALVVNQTIAKALLRQELGPFDKEKAQPYTRVLLDWAANATTQAEWAASAPSKKPHAQQQAAKQAAAKQAAQRFAADEDDEDAQEESEDDYGLGFDLEQPALLDVLQQVCPGVCILRQSTIMMSSNSMCVKVVRSNHAGLHLQYDVTELH